MVFHVDRKTNEPRKYFKKGEGETEDGDGSLQAGDMHSAIKYTKWGGAEDWITYQRRIFKRLPLSSVITFNDDKTYP